MANQKVTNIYNLLSANGLTKAKDVNEFSNWMAGSNYRQNIYGLLKQAGVEGIGSGYGEFTTLTGYGKKQPANATQKAQSIGQSVFGGGGQTDYLARQDNYTRPGALVEQLNQRDKEAEEAITKPLRETAKKVQNRQFTPQKVQYVDENNKVVDEDEVYPVIPKEIAEDELNRMAYDRLQATNKIDLEGEIAKADANATEAYHNAERQNEGLKPSIWQDALHDMADASHVGPVQTKDAYQIAVENDPEYMNRVATLNLLKEADYIQKAAEQSRKTEGKNWRENTVGWFKDAAWGMKENAKKKSTWDNGESTLATFTPLYAAAEKYDRGEQLTDSERELLRSAAIFSAYNDRFSGDISSGVKSGQVTDEAVQFMAEMGINPASGLGKALQKKLVGKGIVKLVENMAESVAKKQGRKAAMKELGKGTLARVGGDLLGAAVMAGTSGLQGVAGDTLQRMQGQSQFGVDTNGNIQYSGRGEDRETNPMVAAAKAFGARTIENHSEMVGAYFAPALGIGGKVLEKGLRSMKLGGVVNFIKSMGATKGAKLIDNFFEKTKWDGTIGEYAEEVVGGIENALVVGDQTLDQDPETGVFNGQQNLETFLSVALMGGFLSTFQTGVGALSYAKGKQQLNRADYLASEALGDEWSGIKQTIDHSTAENASANLSQILSDPNMSPEQKQAVREYAKRKESLRGVLYGEESRKKEKAQEKAATRPANIDVAADGQTVVQKNQNGEVISEEKFDDEEEAKAHADILKMQRAEQDFQDDLATAIEASEQRRQAVENGTPDDFPLSEEMESLVRIQALNRIIPEGVEEGSPEYEAFVRNMDTPGTAENDILLEMMDNFDPLEDAYESVSIDNDSDRNEIDKAIKTDPVKRTERQQKLVSELAAHLHMFNFPKGELHPEQSFADGQTQAELDGAGTMEADPEAMLQMKQSMDDAQQALDDAVAQNTDLAAYVNETINSNEPFAPEDVISGMIGRFSDDEIATVADYINAQSKLDGYLEYTNGKIQQYVERETSKRAFKGKLNGAPSGNMVMVTDGENQYFLVNGDVQVGENGEILSAGEANGIVVVDEEGNIIPMGFDSSLRVEMGATLEEYAASLLQQQQENTTAQMGFEGEPSPNPSEEGDTATETQPAVEEEPVAETQETKTPEEEVAEAPQGTEQEETVSDEKISEIDAALAKIPTRESEKDGEPDYIWEDAPAEDTIDALAAINDGNMDAVSETATMMRKEAESELKKAEKLKTSGKNPIEMAKSRAENRQKAEEAQKRLDYWKAVEEQVKGLIKQAEEAPLRQAEEEDASTRAAIIEEKSDNDAKWKALHQLYDGTIADDGEILDESRPMDINELVAMNMPRNIAWESYTVDGTHVKRGLQDELGSHHTRGIGKNVGTNAFNTFLAKKGTGISIDEAIHQIWESGENELANGEKRFTDQEIRNAVIDMFLSAERPSDITNYVVNNRSRLANEKVKQEEEYMREQEANAYADAEAQARGFADADEESDYNEFIAEEIKLQAEYEQRTEEGTAEQMPPVAESAEGGEQGEGGTAESAGTEREVSLSEPRETETEGDTESGNGDNAADGGVHLEGRESTEGVTPTPTLPEGSETAQSNEEYLASHPLTEEQIMADTEATEDEKLNAIDFLKGEDDSAISRFYYDSIYNRAQKAEVKPQPSENENDPVQALEKASKAFREEQKAKGQQDIDNALDEFNKFLDDAKGSNVLDAFMRKGLEGNDKAQANLLDAFTLTNEAQRMFLKDLLRLASKVGYAYIKKGVHDAQAWSKQMSDSIGKKLKEVLGWDDAIIGEFVDEVWNQKYTADGQRMRMSEHAERLKNNKGTDTAVNVNKKENNVSDNSLSSQEEASEKPKTKDGWLKKMNEVFSKLCEKYGVPDDPIIFNQWGGRYNFDYRITKGYRLEQFEPYYEAYKKKLDDDVEPATEKQLALIDRLAEPAEKEMLHSIKLNKVSASYVISILKAAEDAITSRAATASEFEEYSNELEKVAMLHGWKPAPKLEGDSAEFAERQKKIDTLREKIRAKLKSLVMWNDKAQPMSFYKKLAEEAGLSDLSSTDLQEIIEAEVVSYARELASKEGWSDKQKYDHIVRLYNAQPSLNARDNDRINLQQYSTPAPMAFLMGQFVATTKSQQTMKGLEPSAGNGMLTINLPKGGMHVNDIDEMRLSNLQKQGFGEVTSQDGTQSFGEKQYDVIVTNPPFGNVTPKVYDGLYEISGLEHQMAINALESMKDDGRAAIIIGGNTEYNANGTIKGKDRVFLNYLYAHYNVVDVINMDGKTLYSRQGTGFPVRMILINGRKDFNPKDFAPVQSKARAEQVKSYDELYNRVNDDILRDENKPASVHETESGESGRVDDSANAGNATQTGVRGVRTSGSQEQSAGRPSNRPSVQRSDNTTEQTDNGSQPVVGGRPSGVGGRTEASQPGGRTTSQTGGERDLFDGGNDAERPSAAVGDSQRVGQRGTGTAQQGNGVAVTQQQTEQKAEVKRGLGTEKVPYRKQSGNPFTLQSLMPAEQADVVKEALEKLGDVDQFLVDELGYSNKEELHQALAAEQIDSVAMAIHQMNQGSAFIIGDQTGIGKGRQAAALIRYGVKKGGCPVFITVKKALFSDMYRDLCDIGSPGLRPFIWSADDAQHSGAVTDKDGKVVYQMPSKKEQERVVAYINKHGKLPPEYDYVLTTYDSFKSGTMDYEGGQKKARNFGKKRPSSVHFNGQAKRDALETLAGNSYVIMDESHNAGGEGSNVGYYLQYITTRAKGITFLSATFAKRPGNMPIYSLKTAISKAGVAVSELIDAVKRGGATFQEIMSKALTEAGQMIRRERDMTGVTIDWRGIEDEAVIQKQREQYDKVIGLFNDIINFQRTYVDPIVDNLNDQEADVQGSVDHTPGTRDMGINNTPFASRTYNMVQQILLSLKAEEAAKRAIEHLKAGHKPVITVANTNEGAADEVAAADGESMAMPDLSVNLKKGLRGTLRITRKDAFGNTQNEEIPFDRLSPEGQARYAEIMDAIENASTGLSLSPIDVIKNELKKAGYKVGELTGRQAEFVYNEDGTVKRVKRTDTDKKKVAADFNNGSLDALILNRSAGTGISLHASTKFKDQRQRVMIVAQAQGDVNDEVQIRGRIDRTGQVLRGMYEYVVSQIPSEQRLLMMLKSKLRSLDANTTSSQKSKFNEMDVQDIINKYGDAIVVQYLAEHPDLAEKMQNPLKWKGDWRDMPSEQLISEAEKAEGDGGTASKVLGRMALLTVKEQEQMLDEIGDLYQAEIDRLDEMGENDLEITEMPLKAKTLSKAVWEAGIEPGGNNPFADNTYVEKVQMDVLKKPMKGEEVKGSQERLLSGTDGSNENRWEQYKQKEMAKVNEWAEQKKKETTETITARAEKKAKAEQEKYVKGAKKSQEKNGLTDAEIEKNGQLQYDHFYNEEMEKLDKALAGIEAQRQVFEVALDSFSTDGVYAIPMNIYDLGSMTFEPGIGKLIDVKISENFSPNSSTLTFATLDGRRKITVPINGRVKQQNGEKRELFPVMTTLTAQARHGMFGQNVANTLKVLEQNLDNWDKLTSTAARKEGYIITGNLLKALVSTREQGAGGKLISYTTDTGEVKQGILMPDNFDPGALTSNTPISSMKEELRYSRDKVESADGEVSIRVTSEWDWKDGGYNTLELTVPKSKKKGEKYFNDEILLSLMNGQFEGSGKMKAEFPRANLDAVMKRLDEMGVTVKEEKKDSGTRLREVEEYTEEEQQIIDDAKNNGTFMKAPNGKRTKLSEKQWVRVRTKAFKKWFGDWENDPANASKIVDENGEPLVVYHGSKKTWTVYDKNVFKRDQFGRGIYLSEERDNAESYGNVREFFVNAKNPFYAGYIYDNNGKKSNRVNAAGLLFNHELISKDNYVEELKNYINEDEATTIGTELKNSDAVVVSYRARTSTPGYKYGEIIVSDPNQIKSATDNVGTYSSENDDIRFREGSAPANSQPAEKMKEHLTKLSKKIGTKVVFHDDASTITNAKVKEALQKGKKVAGWFDPKDNSVHFYMPNIKDRYEAEKTIWHEVVGHKGMRALLGEEGYRTFMRRLWMDKSEDFEEMHQWVVENYMRYGGNLYETMDEWFAYNVVEPSVPKTMWDKVMLVLSDILRKLGFMTTPNMKDMKYMLWLSRNAIKEGDAWTELQRNATLAKLDLESRRRASAYGKDAARARDGFANTPTGDTEREMYRNGLMRKMFAWTEAHQDYMASAKLLMDAILKGRKVLDRFNFYMKENHADSKIKIMEDLYVRDYCKPMEDAINRCVAAIGGKLSEAYDILEDYMAMKHGLERNREFFVRDWMEEKRKKTPTIDDLDEEAKSEYESAARGIEQGFEDGTIETEEERDKELKKALEDSYSAMLDRIDEGWAAAKAQPTDNLAEWLKGLDDYIRQHIDDEYEAGKHDYSGLTAMQPTPTPPEGTPTPTPPEGMGSKGYDYDDDAVIGYVMDMESKIGEENVTELWKQKGRMTQFALDIEHEAGLITDRNYDKVSQMFHWYMPLRKWDEDMAEDIWSYMNSKKNTYVGRTLMKAGGRKSRAAMPIGTMFAMGGNAISRAARNEVKKAFAGFVRMYERPAANNDNDNDPLVTELEAWVENLGTEENPDWVYSFPDIPENATADEVREAKDAWAQHMLELMQEGRAMRVRQGDTIPYRFESKKRSRPEHIIEVYEEGQPHFFIVNDNPRAAQAINGQLKPEMKHKNTAIVNRLLSSLATSYSPTFVVRNAFRDAEYALNILLVKEGRNYAGRYVKNYAKLMLNGTQKDSVPLIYTLFKKFREGTLDESNEMERYFKEFAENGGITGYVMENNAERWEKEILAGVKEIGKSKAVRVTKNIGNLIKEGLDRYGEGVENAARFATYMTSRQGAKNKNGRTYSEMPRSIIRSVHDAKEVSVNFNRKGAGYKTESLLNEKGEKTTNAVAAAKTAQYMRANTLFYNAGLQGVMNSLTNAKKKPWWFAAKFAVPAMTLGMVMALANYGLALLLDDDDDRKKYGTDPYADLPEYTRRQNVCIYLGHGKFVMIPLSIEHRALYGIGDILAGEGAVDGFTDYKGENLKSVDHPLGLDILRQLTAFSPVDYNSKETGIEGVTGWGVGIMMPAYVSPFVNAYFNTRWTGVPIQNESKYDNGTTPEYQLAKDYTNDLMVSGSKLWHELWGGNEVQRAGRAEGNRFSKAVGSVIGDKAVEFIGEISPAKMEYIIEQYSGETVKGGAGVKNLFEMMFGDKKMDLRKVPIAKAFLTTPNDNTLYRRTNTKYWKYVDEFRKVAEEDRAYKKKVESEDGKTKDLYEKYFNRFKESKRYRQWRIYHPAKGQGTRNYKKEIDGWTDKIKNESDPIQKSGYTMDRNLVIYELVEQLEGTE